MDLTDTAGRRCLLSFVKTRLCSYVGIAVLGSWELVALQWEGTKADSTFH